MLLKELCHLYGPAGYEHRVRKYIQEYIEGKVDEITVDALGNLIALKKGSGVNKKKIMLAAHMDEIGFQVKKIDEGGIVKFIPLGTLFYHMTYMSRVRFENGLLGIVSNVADVGDGGGMDKFHIEIGAGKEANEHVKIGDTAVYIGEYEELLDHKITGKALDDRIGCYMLMKAIDEIKTPYNDVYFVFTVQEELGCRGGQVSAQRVQPEIGIAVDVSPAGDYPCAPNEVSNALGKGVGVKISDPSVICDPYLAKEMIICCEDNDIEYQRDVIGRGGTDAGVMNRSNMGVRSAGITIALRHPHGPNGIADLRDIENGIKLIVHYVDVEFSW